MVEPAVDEVIHFQSYTHHAGWFTDHYRIR